MEDIFALAQGEAGRARALSELAECNALTTGSGLALSQADMLALTESRYEALKATGRVEFGGGVLKKLVAAFADSPYISQQDYAATLSELQEAFYYFKGESLETLSDDELIAAMARFFNGEARGAVEYLTGTSLEELCRGRRGKW